MSRHTAAWLAWSLWALFVAFMTIGILFNVVDGPSQNADDEAFVGFGELFIVTLVIFATVGSLVASRRSENPIGWLFCGVGLTFGLEVFAEGYARHTLNVAPGSLPGGAGMALVADWTNNPSFLGWFIFLFLLFPDGRLPSRGWRLIAWLAVVVTAANFFTSALKPGPLTTFPSVTNPIGIDALSSIAEWPVFWLLMLLLLISVISLVLRLRRARGDERQQLKWFVSAGALLAVIFLVGPVIWLNPAIPQVLWSVLFLVGISAIPIAAGIAIFKYRLYDIDVIINRTLVYGALTAALGLVYVGSVVVLQAVFRTLTGQERSELVTVASTLAIAALFTPLRRRIQAVIDRRFYRRKYDAAKILAAFNARLRDELDLNELTNDLLVVVEETIQPVHASLWLREPPQKT